MLTALAKLRPSLYVFRRTSKLCFQSYCNPAKEVKIDIRQVKEATSCDEVVSLLTQRTYTDEKEWKSFENAAQCRLCELMLTESFGRENLIRVALKIRDVPSLVGPVCAVASQWKFRLSEQHMSRLFQRLGTVVTGRKFSRLEDGSSVLFRLETALLQPVLDLAVKRVNSFEDTLSAANILDGAWHMKDLDYGAFLTVALPHIRRSFKAMPTNLLCRLVSIIASSSLENANSVLGELVVELENHLSQMNAFQFLSVFRALANVQYQVDPVFLELADVHMGNSGLRQYRLKQAAQFANCLLAFEYYQLAELDFGAYIIALSTQASDFRPSDLSTIVYFAAIADQVNTEVLAAVRTLIIRTMGKNWIPLHQADCLLEWLATGRPVVAVRPTERSQSANRFLSKLNKLSAWHLCALLKAHESTQFYPTKEECLLLAAQIKHLIRMTTKQAALLCRRTWLEERKLALARTAGKLEISVRHCFPLQAMTDQWKESLGYNLHQLINSSLHYLTQVLHSLSYLNVGAKDIFRQVNTYFNKQAENGEGVLDDLLIEESIVLAWAGEVQGVPLRQLLLSPALSELSTEDIEFLAPQHQVYLLQLHATGCFDLLEETLTFLQSSVISRRQNTLLLQEVLHDFESKYGKNKIQLGCYTNAHVLCEAVVCLGDGGKLEPVHRQEGCMSAKHLPQGTAVAVLVSKGLYSNGSGKPLGLFAMARRALETHGWSVLLIDAAELDVAAKANYVKSMSMKLIQNRLTN